MPPTAANETRTLTASATAPNIGPRMAPKTAAPKAVPISSPRRSRGAATVNQANAPAQVIVLEAPWTNRASPSAQGPSAAAKAKLAKARRMSPETTASFGPISRGGQPAGDGAEHGAGPEGAHEQPGAGLREPELVGVAGHERRERPKQHRVDKHDHTDKNKKRAHHDPTLPTEPSANDPSGQERLSEPRTRRTQLQGSWRESGSASADSDSRLRHKEIQRAGCAFVRHTDGLSASAYGLPVWTRPTRVPCSLQGGI